LLLALSIDIEQRFFSNTASTSYRWVIAIGNMQDVCFLITDFEFYHRFNDKRSKYCSDCRVHA